MSGAKHPAVQIASRLGYVDAADAELLSRALLSTVATSVPRVLEVFDEEELLEDGMQPRLAAALNAALGSCSSCAALLDWFDPQLRESGHCPHCGMQVEVPVLPDEAVLAWTGEGAVADRPAAAPGGDELAAPPAVDPDPETDATAIDPHVEIESRGSSMEDTPVAPPEPPEAPERDVAPPYERGEGPDEATVAERPAPGPASGPTSGPAARPAPRGRPMPRGRAPAGDEADTSPSSGDVEERAAREPGRQSGRPRPAGRPAPSGRPAPRGRRQDTERDQPESRPAARSDSPDEPAPPRARPGRPPSAGAGGIPPSRGARPRSAPEEAPAARPPSRSASRALEAPPSSGGASARPPSRGKPPVRGSGGGPGSPPAARRPASRAEVDRLLNQGDSPESEASTEFEPAPVPGAAPAHDEDFGVAGEDHGDHADDPAASGTDGEPGDEGERRGWFGSIKRRFGK